MLKELIERALARRHPPVSREQIKAEVLARHDEIGRGLSERFSRGNVNLKRGAILTRDDLDARAKRRSG